MPTLHEGELITPSLKLLRPLASGGMGTVWVARHLGLKSDVAVKFVTGEGAADEEAIARFEREATAASEVRSPHVVQVFDHGRTQSGVPYIAMELLEGEDLAARIGRLRVLPPGEVAGVVVQVARALARAHDKSVIHRDIKPENIFLCETGDHEAFVKVLDFGIAKFTASSELSGTTTGAMVGTPYYMSPEQIVGSKATDFRTDLWSLGVVAFHAMTGRRPFEADTIGGLAVLICGQDLPRASLFNARLTPALDAWFAKACARDPNDRYPTARAMADALLLAVGGSSVATVRSKSSAPEAIADTDSAILVAPPLALGETAPLPRFAQSAATLASGTPAPVEALASTTAASSRRGSVANAGAGASKSRRTIGVVGILVLAIAGVVVAVTRASSTRSATRSATRSSMAEASPTPPVIAPPSESAASTTASAPEPIASSREIPVAPPTTSAAPTSRASAKPAPSIALSIALSIATAPSTRASVSASSSPRPKPPPPRPREEALE